MISADPLVALAALVFATAILTLLARAMTRPSGRNAR